MRTTPKSGAAHCHTLEAWLCGTVAAPKPGDPVTESLRFLIQDRFGLRVPSAAWLYGTGEIADRGLAQAWGSAWEIVAGFEAADKDRRASAEAWVREQMRVLFAVCLDRVVALEATNDFWLGDGSAVGVRDEYRLLVDIIALSLLEMGDPRGRQHIATEAGRCLQEANSTKAEAAAYARVVLGLSSEPLLPWRPGSGALGILPSAISDGQLLLFGAAPHAIRAEGDDHDLHRQQLAEVEALTGGLRSVPEPQPVVDDDPSLLVLASVDHLPGSTESGSAKPGTKTGMTARAEWASFASVRWPLLRVPDLAAARAELVAEFPYAEGIVDAVLGDLVGRPHIYLRPILLVGGPGSGKTRLARRLAEVLGLGQQVYGCAGVADAAFSGTSRQWSTGRASVPLQVLKRLSAASALLVLDELEKAGTRTENGCILDALLPFLTDDSKRIFDPFLECAVDLSGVSYIATANNVAGLRRSHPALVDRFRVYAMPAPRPEDLPVVCRTVLADLRAERGLGPEWLPDLDGEELDLVAQHYDGGSLRVVRRLCETLVAGREALAVRQ